MALDSSLIFQETTEETKKIKETKSEKDREEASFELSLGIINYNPSLMLGFRNV